MALIKTNEHELTVSSVVSTTLNRNGKSYPAFKFIFEGAVTAKDIAALTSSGISIDGNQHEGYTTLGEISVTVAKVTTAEKELSETQTQLADIKNHVAVLLPQLSDATALSAVELFPAWATGETYAVGDRISRNGQLYKVIQDHVSQNDWKPEDATSLYTEIKLSESGYDSWKQPTGAHDAYNTGDTVEYNGVLYKSLIDGNIYAPDAYAEGWEQITE